MSCVLSQLKEDIEICQSKTTFEHSITLNSARVHGDLALHHVRPFVRTAEGIAACLKLYDGPFQKVWGQIRLTQAKCSKESSDFRYLNLEVPLS